MKRSLVLRPGYYAYVTVASVLAVAAANCGGGERPPPEGSGPIGTGGSTSNGNPVTIGGVSDDQLFFGDNGMVNCGEQALGKAVTLTNPNLDIVNFKATLT